LTRDLWASREPRDLSARRGKIDKFLIGPHKTTARNRQASYLIQKVELLFRRKFVRRAGASERSPPIR
jgi:hypothetical protein